MHPATPGAIDQPPHASPSDTLRDRVYRKAFWRLIPFLMVCYAIAYLDRVNIGFAKLGMSADLGLSEGVYGLGAGIFFVGYFLFEVPSNAMLHRLGARTWITRIMLTWAIISGACAFIDGPVSFYVARFMLGIAEAGFFPGIILYLTYWFPASRRGKIIAIFMIAIPLAGLVGAPLSGTIMTWFDGAHGWAGWRWMFLLEAAPALLLGLCLPFILSSRVDDAKWLSNEEKAMIAADLEGEARGQAIGHARLRDLIGDPLVVRLAFIYFCCIMGQYGITFWLPTLVASAGHGSPLVTGLLSALPYACAVVVMPLVCGHSDRTGERHWHLVLPMAIGGIAMLVATLVSSSIVVSMAVLCVATAATLTATPMFWTLPTGVMRGQAAAVGIAAINSIGNVAGFASPSVVGFVNDRTGSPIAGMAILTLMLLGGGAMVLSLSRPRA